MLLLPNVGPALALHCGSCIRGGSRGDFVCAIGYACGRLIHASMIARDMEW